MGGFGVLLNHAIDAYQRNLKLISAFSIPFLIAFPLSLLLPNFVALSATFLRIGSIKTDLSTLDSMLIIAAIVFAIVFFSFAIAAINVVVKSQRTLNRLTSRDIGLIESSTLNLFFIYITAFAVIVAFNLLAFEYAWNPALGMLFGLVVSLLVLFAPQAVVIEEQGLSHAISRSITLIEKKFSYVILFLITAAILLLVNTWFFLELGKALWFSRFIALIIQSMFILPFLEVLKTQIYLSKYALL